MVYATDLFDEQTVRRLLERFIDVLDHLSAHPEASVSDAPLLTETERAEVLAWSRGPSVGGPAVTLVELAASRVR